MSILAPPSQRPHGRRQPSGGRSIRRVVVPVVILWGLASTGFAIAISVGAPEPQLAGRLYAAATAAAVLTILVARLSATSRGEDGLRFDELIAPRDGTEEPDSPSPLEFIEQSIRFATSSAGDLHTRLRPVLRQVAAHRLAARNIGLDTPRHQEAAEAILGPMAFDLVRKDRPRPAERFAAGATRASIEHVIETLERLP
jgi:hypothetical protein